MEKIFLIIFLTAILACIAAFFIRVRNIEVVDNEYVSEEVIKNSILSKKRNDTLLFLYVKNIVNKGKYDIPHVENIRLHLNKNFKLEAIVKEKPILGYVKKLDKLYYFDEDLYIAFKSDKRDEDKIEVVGINTNEIETGIYMSEENNNINILFLVKSINNFLTRNGLLIDAIEITKNQEIMLVKDKISYKIGSMAYIEEKLNLALNTYNSIRDKSGVLDLSKVNTKDDRGEYIFKKK